MANSNVTDGTASPENLALLYQGLLTGIVRLQSGRQRITSAESFRKRTKATLQEVEQVALSSGYDGRDIKDTHFAVVALLDAVVLHSDDPVRTEWERKTLQEELFGQTDAGIVFFEKLERLRTQQDSVRLADVLEVYLLCLLLGFEGRYAGPLRAELESITEVIGRRIDDIRGRSQPISPVGNLSLAPQPRSAQTEGAPRLSQHLRTAALASLVFTFLLFLAFYWNLWVASDDLRTRLLSQTGVAQ